MRRKRKTALGGAAGSLGTIGRLGRPSTFASISHLQGGVNSAASNFDKRLSLKIDAVINALDNETRARKQAKLLARKRALESRIED